MILSYICLQIAQYSNYCDTDLSEPPWSEKRYFPSMQEEKGGGGTEKTKQRENSDFQKLWTRDLIYSRCRTEGIVNMWRTEVLCCCLCVHVRGKKSLKNKGKSRAKPNTSCVPHINLQFHESDSVSFTLCCFKLCQESFVGPKPERLSLLLSWPKTKGSGC